MTTCVICGVVQPAAMDGADLCGVCASARELQLPLFHALKPERATADYFEHERDRRSDRAGGRGGLPASVRRDRPSAP